MKLIDGLSGHILEVDSPGEVQWAPFILYRRRYPWEFVYAAYNYCPKQAWRHDLEPVATCQGAGEPEVSVEYQLDIVENVDMQFGRKSAPLSPRLKFLGFGS